MQADPILQRAIRTWLVWDGSKTMLAPQPSTGLDTPKLEMQPTIGPMGLFDASGFSAFLQVRMRLEIQSFDAEDYLNFWTAIMDSLWPYGERGRQLDIEQRLLDQGKGGATTGQWQFPQPAAVPVQMASENTFVCAGMMQIEVRHQFQ